MKMEAFGNNYVTVLDSSKSVHTTIKGMWYCFQSLLLFCVNEKKRFKNATCIPKQIFFWRTNIETKMDFFLLKALFLQPGFHGHIIHYFDVACKSNFICSIT